MWEAYQPCCLGLPQSFVCRGGVGCVVHVCAGLVLAVWIGLLPLCDLFVFPRCFWVLLPSAIAPAQPGNKSNRNDLIIWSGHCFSWFSNPSKSFSWIHFGRSFGLFGNFVFGLLLPEFFRWFSVYNTWMMAHQRSPSEYLICGRPGSKLSLKFGR